MNSKKTTNTYWGHFSDGYPAIISKLGCDVNKHVIIAHVVKNVNESWEWEEYRTILRVGFSSFPISSLDLCKIQKWMHLTCARPRSGCTWHVQDPEVDARGSVGLTVTVMAQVDEIVSEGPLGGSIDINIGIAQ